jgi:hypothetical protein
MRVMDELAQRAEQLKRNDPAQSQAMRQAAQRGRQQQLQRAMEQAAQQLEQNQTNTAQEQQQRAQQAMEQMLGDLDQAQRSRDQALRRTLESLLESIEALIAAQERELQILANAGEREAGTKPESGMVRLHTNTLAAADQAATSREMSGVMRLLGEAGEKQVAAIQALRTEPIETESAQAAEQASLERLNEALPRPNAWRSRRRRRMRIASGKSCVRHIARHWSCRRHSGPRRRASWVRRSIGASG